MDDDPKRDALSLQDTLLLAFGHKFDLASSAVTTKQLDVKVSPARLTEVRRDRDAAKERLFAED